MFVCATRGAASAEGSDMPRSTCSISVCRIVSGIVEPPAAPIANAGARPSNAITGPIEDRGSLPGPDFGELLELAKTLEVNGRPASRDGAVRERLADWYIQSKGLEYTRMRALTALSRGQMPGPESSIYKAVSASKIQEIAMFALDLMDSAGMVSDPQTAPMRAVFQDALLYAPAGRIAGGTDEILKNIIAERVLGLPGDIRVDREAPFNALPA